MRVLLRTCKSWTGHGDSGTRISVELRKYLVQLFHAIVVIALIAYLGRLVSNIFSAFLFSPLFQLLPSWSITMLQTS